MRTLYLNKARGAAGLEVVFSLRDADNLGSNPEARRLYFEDAEAFFEAMLNHMPGGTYDRLCVLLQRYWRKCSHLSGRKYSCAACGWRGSVPLFTPASEREFPSAFCPECEAPATVHDTRAGNDGPDHRLESAAPALLAAARDAVEYLEFLGIPEGEAGSRPLRQLIDAIGLAVDA